MGSKLTRQTSSSTSSTSFRSSLSLDTGSPVSSTRHPLRLALIVYCAQEESESKHGNSNSASGGHDDDTSDAETKTPSKKSKESNKSKEKTAAAKKLKAEKAADKKTSTRSSDTAVPGREIVDSSCVQSLPPSLQKNRRHLAQIPAALALALVHSLW